MIKEFMKIVEAAEGITDAWFAHGSFETYKKPAKELRNCTVRWIH